MSMFRYPLAGCLVGLGCSYFKLKYSKRAPAGRKEKGKRERGEGGVRYLIFLLDGHKGGVQPLKYEGFEENRGGVSIR